jgi:hypothetical protein
MPTELSLVRLYLLRAGYLLLAVGLELTVWPSILDAGKSWELMHGVVAAMLGAMGLLALLGLRYPLQMLPLLFFELTWKTIWLLRVALPLWLGHRLDADTSETAIECLIVVVYLVLIPWPYVFKTYVTAPGAPWRARRRAPDAGDSRY